jgi:hypothetical protein
MSDKQVIDVVGLSTALAAIVFSAEVADLVGPYMVIVGGAVFGASFALARRDKTRRPSAVWFMTRVAGLAILLTVSLASLVNAYRPDLQVRVLLAPISLLVGFVGDDWPKVLSKVMRMVWAAVDLMRSKGGTP